MDVALIGVIAPGIENHRRGVRAHARGRVLVGIAFTMTLAAACHSDHQVAIDAAGSAAPDAPLVCADPTRMAEPADGQFTVPGDSCACGGASEMTVDVTFDGKGNAIKVAASSGQTLSASLAKCFLDLLADYCYPSLAGMSQTALTCHA